MNYHGARWRDNFCWILQFYSEICNRKENQILKQIYSNTYSYITSKQQLKPKYIIQIHNSNVEAVSYQDMENGE